jgi:hypothetical protein
MRDPIESKVVERSSRLYQRLLTIYPKAHREAYGSAMLQLFRDQCRDAWTTRRTCGLLVCWLHTLSDLLKTSLLEHLSSLNRTKSMLKLFRPQFRPVAVFFSVFATVFLLTVSASALIAFLYPNTFRSTARLMLDQKRPGTRAGPSTFSSDSYFLQTEFEIIQSHAVLSQAVETLKLCDTWGKNTIAARR